MVLSMPLVPTFQILVSGQSPDFKSAPFVPVLENIPGLDDTGKSGLERVELQ